MMRRLICTALWFSAFAVHAANAEPQAIPDQLIVASPAADDATAAAVNPSVRTDAGQLGFMNRDPDAYSIVSVARGFSTHKPIFIMPLTYSPDFDGRSTEVLFQISAKQRLFNRNFYFGYTQKSFWQLYNKAQSSPFRETNYNPELFYRWSPDPVKFRHWGADVGFEHESNGKNIPDSRSWNRIYVAPFQAKGKYLAYFKFWYRIREDAKTSPSDARGDDNPDIERFYGYSEFQFQRQFGGDQQAWVMLRGNPATGKGALSLNYSVPNSDGSLFYCFNLWQGYGESLIDYNRSITRLGVGIMFSR